MPRRSSRPIAIHCQVSDGGEVRPDPGYEGDYMEVDGFRGNARFAVLPEDGHAPAQVVCMAGRLAEVAAVVLPLLPVFRVAALQYVSETWDPFGPAWGSPVTFGPGSAVLATNQGWRDDPATAPDDSYSVMQVINGRRRELKRIYVYAYQGEDNGVPGAYPYTYAGINNRAITTPINISIDLHRADYDSTDPYSVPVHSYVTTLSGILSPASVPDGMPLDNYSVDGIDWGIAAADYIDVSGTVLEVLFEDGVDPGFWYYFKNLTLSPP